MCLVPATNLVNRSMYYAFVQNYLVTINRVHPADLVSLVRGKLTKLERIIMSALIVIVRFGGARVGVDYRYPAPLPAPLI